MIKAENITYAYGKKQVLRQICMHAPVGTCAGIAGVNGCGKSTFLSILSGALMPQGGTLHIMGQNALSQRRLFGAVGYVPQENALIEELSVFDNLRLWYGGKKQVVQALEHGFLSVLNMQELLKMPAGKLSGGQKKRVNIGCAMAGEPPILIMDEPGAALDMVCKQEIYQYLRIYLEHKGTIVIATHDTMELDLCDLLYVMRDGRLYETNPALRGAQLMKEFLK